MSRFIPRKELGISDKVDKVLETKGDIADIVTAPVAQDVIDRKLEKYGYTEDFYIKESKLAAVHKLVLRKATTEQMADILSISKNEVSELRIELKERLTASLRSEDPMNFVSESMAFYDEVLGESMRLLDKIKEKGYNRPNDIVRALEIAIKARTEKDNFLIKSGILNNNQQNEHVQDSETLTQARGVRALLGEIMSGDDEKLSYE